MLKGHRLKNDHSALIIMILNYQSYGLILNGKTIEYDRVVRSHANKSKSSRYHIEYVGFSMLDDRSSTV